ncbi:hypothetical protein [Tunturiibacter gelidoferens]|uniref:Intracellular proteinase inhibitor BsuPI domain-containing protein n=1 Tax=Tunturiibacter lichenicola TaxID=2051959 RepID=A0A7Y9NIC7_9BACT|nr:hypothetical protein [Edaphobacter lichenicola]NYF49833.1 hypothetical protein [Edaphobacter lichenicola]
MGNIDGPTIKWRLVINKRCTFRLESIPMQRAPLVKLVFFLVLFFISATVQAVDVQSTEDHPTCPGLKLEIGIPDDVVRPQSDVLLELRLTNVAHEAILLPSGSPDFWSYEFELKDERGALVPRTAEWMHALSQRPTIVTANVSIPLSAGASLTKAVLLEKLFDLTRPGRYTLRVSFGSVMCGNSAKHVTSNLVQFTVGAPSIRPLTPKAAENV